MRIHLFVLSTFICMVGRADIVNDQYLALKNDGLMCQAEFYSNLSNSMNGVTGLWQTNGGEMVFASVVTNSSISNVFYAVRISNASTNLTSIEQVMLNGHAVIYRFANNHSLSMIECYEGLSGDLKFYQPSDASGDLEYYLASTNFIAPHGIRQYQNGEVVREGTPPNDFLKLLKDSRVP